GTALSAAGPEDDSRTFASCVQPPARGRILHWTGSDFAYSTLEDSGNLMTELKPANDKGPPRELVLSCGAHRVHAFAVFGASSAILGASWDPTLGWSPWVPVVDESPGGLPRCFLTGFDRVAGAAGDEVGIAWSEVSTCASPPVAEPTRLYAAFVK